MATVYIAAYYFLTALLASNIDYKQRKDVKESVCKAIFAKPISGEVQTELSIKDVKAQIGLKRICLNRSIPEGVAE